MRLGRGVVETLGKGVVLLNSAARGTKIGPSAKGKLFLCGKLSLKIRVGSVVLALFLLRFPFFLYQLPMVFASSFISVCFYVCSLKRKEGCFCA